MRSSWGELFGITFEHRRVPGRGTLGRGQDGHVGIGRDGPLDPGQGGLSGTVTGGGGGERPGAVEAGAEALGEAVVGDAGGGALPVVAVVGLAEAQRGERHGEQHQYEPARDRSRERPARDQPRPAPEAARGLDVLGALRPQPPREGAHQRRQHRHGANSDHRDEIAEPIPMRPTNGMPVASRPAIATTTIAPGRNHGGARSGVRDARRVGDAVAARKLLG